MKKAFTMIELIFAIVIIGILSSVAIPKLVASRDDATATRCIVFAQQFVQEVSIYYTVHGEIGNISDMSNIPVDGSDIGFTDNIDLRTDSAQFYCEQQLLLQYTTSINATAVILGATSLSPSLPPATFIADKTLKENSFYKTYLLGGYTN